MAERTVGNSARIKYSADFLCKTWQGWLIPSTGSWLFLAGCLLVCWGLVHLGAWLLSSAPWEGDTSLRKPALFGLSGGVTLLSLFWLQRLLPRTGIDRGLALVTSTAMLLEVALISMQQWRGVPSHFNRNTSLDRWIDSSITGLISIVLLALLIYAYRTFFTMRGPPDQRLAWQSGMAFLLMSCLIGVAILIYGIGRVAHGENPHVFGNAGVIKFPHGIAIHAIQALPLACWLMALLGIGLDRRIIVLKSLNISISILLIYSLVQTLGGRARGDVTPATSVLLMASVIFASPFVFTLVRHVFSRQAQRTHRAAQRSS